MTQSRRSVLTAFGAGVTVLSGCSALGNNGAAAYEQADLNFAIGIECASTERDRVIVTLSWEWATGVGGAAPRDMAVIDWPDEKWELLTAAHRTTDLIRFDGKGVVGGMEGVRFRHVDADAEEGVTYAASCKLAPRDDFEAETRKVFGRFAHVRQDSTRSRDDGWFGDVTEAWYAVRETDQGEAPCGDSST